VNEYLEDRKEQGFTLIELLIAIVVVGILAAVAIVGIAGLTNTGGKSACTATADAAHAASAAYYANHSNQWPTNFDQMTGGTDPVLELQPGVHTATGDNTTLTNDTWVLKGDFTATPGGAPKFDPTAAGNCNTPA